MTPEFDPKYGVLMPPFLLFFLPQYELNPIANASETAMETISKHAAKRRQQRGINERRWARFWEHADVDQPALSNCRLYRVSTRTCRALPDGERFATMGVIVADDTGEIVTVLHIKGNARGRRYRRAA